MKRRIYLILQPFLLSLLFYFVLSLPTQYHYRIGWVLRFFLILFYFPIQEKNKDPFPLFPTHFAFHTLLLPLALTTAYLEDIALAYFFCLEIVLIIGGTQISILFRKAKNLSWDRYVSLIFLLTTFPMILYYLYFDLVGREVAWLLYLPPWGIFFLGMNV